MNKSLLIVASLALGTTAIAQDMPANAPAQGSPPMTNTPAPGGTDTSMPSQSGMQPADPNAPAPSGGMTPPDSGMTPPAPADNGSMPMSNGSATGAPADTSSYPKCSSTVTDKCVQGAGMTHKRMMKKRPH